MFKLEEATITDIQTAVAAGEISYRELALEYLERIAEVDSCEGGLNSVLEINPDVLEIARFMDDERTKGVPKGPLHGIPVMLKDNICTCDRMNTSAGSLALADNQGYEAEIVRGLRENGAVILGKANMTEFANWMTKDMPNGYSSRGGQVKNPFNREADPSGSSTGSAVAVSANLCTVSVGTETHGSIISPSYSNGIVGIKPTAGLLNGNGIIPISSTLDTAGPMARTVYDAAVLLSGLKSMYPYPHLHGYALTSVYHHHGQNVMKDYYTSQLATASLRGLRVGIYGNESDDSEYNEILYAALSEIEKEGAILTKDLKPIITDSCWNYAGKFIAKHEFKRSMDFFLTGHGYTGATRTRLRTLKEIIEYNEANSELCLKYGQTVLLECQNESSGTLKEAEYITALRRRENLIKDFDRLIRSNNLDVIICTNQFDGVAPIGGFPCGTLPIGKNKNNIPMGMCFIAKHNDEATLLKAMYAVEKLTGNRENPLTPD